MSTVPRWHEDPAAPGSGRQRYWDGQDWTDWVMDPSAAEPRVEAWDGGSATVVAEPARRRARLLGLVAGGAVLAVVAGGVATVVLSRVVEQQVADLGALVGGDEEPATLEGQEWFEQAYMDYVSLSTDGTDVESQADALGRDGLISRGHELCAVTDGLDGAGFADYYEVLGGSEEQLLEAVIVEASQYYLCDVDQMTGYWEDYFGDGDGDADAMPDLDDAEGTYLWILDSYELELDRDSALEAGRWVCDRIAADKPDTDEQVYALILDVGAQFALDELDSSILYGTAGTLCPEVTGGLYGISD